MALVKPHGKKKKLMPLLLTGTALDKELKKAKSLKQLKISSRETGDLVMMGIGVHAAHGLHGQEGLEGRLRQVQDGGRHVLADTGDAFGEHGFRQLAQEERRDHPR
jgi:hypothetical protein